MHDPDAVSQDFVHWLVWDIPTSTKNIAPSTVPVGAIQGKNGAGASQYMGPCPPDGTGTHHYKFEIYALDTTLGLDSNTNRPQLESAMSGHVVAHYTLTGTVAAK
jgi:Raf kinase inhibitor-like YbhB/YbcL family protein